MRVVLDINNKWAGVLSLTAVTSMGFSTGVTVTCVDLSKGKYIRIDENGEAHQSESEPPKEDTP